MQTAQRNITLPLVVEVRYSNGAYVTQTVARQRASCTHSDQAAADGLAGKLCTAVGLPAGSLRASRMGTVGAGRSLWSITRPDTQEAS